MKQESKYEEDKVITILSKKQDIFIPREERKIYLLHGSRSKGDVGINSRGKIDFLVNYKGYTPVWVVKFP